jgi:hypothetical protein
MLKFRVALILAVLMPAFIVGAVAGVASPSQPCTRPDVATVRGIVVRTCVGTTAQPPAVGNARKWGRSDARKRGHRFVEF